MKRVSTTFLSLILCLGLFAQAPSGYYDNAIGKKGEALKSALNDIIDGHTELTYSQCWDALKVTDRDPNNSNNVIGIYSRFSMDADAEYAGGSGWNREHVWAKSRGDFGTSQGAGTDIHHLRACDVSTNSARSNKAFDDGGSTYVDGSGNYSGTTPAKSDSDSWEPGDGQKGDVARMVFYMATRYEGENGEPDLELTDQIFGTSDKQPLHGRISALLAWHEADPVDQEEINRHEAIYSFQGNRNPFIDHPEWVDDIWGDGSNVTATISISASSTLSFGEVAAGESSASQSYSVSGTDLEGNITVSVSAPFELSTNNSSWSQSLTVSQATAEGGGQTVFVRFSPTTQNSQFYSQNISHTSTGASAVTLNVTGTENTITSDPFISISASSLDFGEVNAGASSTSQSYVVSGSNLIDDVSVSVSEPFEISTNNSSWSQSLVIAQAVAETGQSVFVRFSPTVQNGQVFNQTITHTSTNATSKTLNVSGEEATDVPDPEISTSLSQIDFGQVLFGDSEERTYTLFALNLVDDLTVTPPDELVLSLNSDFSVVYTSASPLVITPTVGEIGQTTIYIRYTPPVDDGSSFDEYILHSTSGATRNVQVTGSEFAEPVVPTGWINEFHYTNSGADQNEFIELYLEDASEYNLADFTIELVENDGSVYSSFLVSSMTEGSTGYFTRNFGGIKDGPNGIRVRYELDVIHAISYGGSIADFELIGVEEDDNTSSETSIQLCCGSTNYDDMEWTKGNVATPGVTNEAVTLSLPANEFFIYPNPTEGNIRLAGVTGQIELELSDLNGKSLISTSGDIQVVEKTLNEKLPTLNSGTYLLSIEQQRARVVTRLIIQD